MSNRTVALVFTDGVLAAPDPHDGHFEGLILSRDEARSKNPDLTIRWSALDKMTYELTIPRVVAMRFTDFLKGNIIFDFEATSAAKLADVDLAFLYGFGGPPERNDFRDFGLSSARLGFSY